MRNTGKREEEAREEERHIGRQSERHGDGEKKKRSATERDTT